MAELGIIVAEKLIEVIGSAIIKEICDMWDYKSELEDLNQTVSTIKNVLLDADSKRQLSQATRGYIEELKAAVYDADDLFDEFFTLAELKLLDANRDDKCLKKVRRFFSGKKKGVSQAHRMSRQVKKIKLQLDTIVSNHHNFGLSVDYNPICRRREETCSQVDAGDMIGREDDKQIVIDMLLGPNDVHESFRFVTIVGVGGLGKTALAQLVYNDNQVEAEFPDPKSRLWVCVSDQDGEQFDVKVILCKILELVSGNRRDDTSSKELVQLQLQEQLRGKKYLLVLDDVWNENREKWRDLYTFLTKGQEGSRIVVTTRSERTADIIGGKHTHKLQGLSEENSWLLFESVAFDKGEHEHASQLELVEIGKRIVEKCYNIPLVIKVVGSLLFKEPVNKWQTFEHSGFAGIGNGDNNIMTILKLSYHNLRPSLKNCFSYCALFPKDYRLKRKELISLWIAQGYIASLDRDQSIEDAAEEHFLILVRRCFFQDVEKDEYGDIQCVKMHDLMHDVALEVGREEIGVVSSNTSKLGDKVRHVYFARGTFSQNYSLKSKIRSFISLWGKLGYRVNAHIEGVSWMCVRVLVLQGAGIVRLPDSIGKLLHLRYLDLSFNYNLEGLSDSISRLHNLQTLDLNCGVKLRELPKNFSELIKLRHLDLNRCTKLTSMPCMDKLTNLRYLNISNCHELSSLPSSMDKLTSLRHFELRDCPKLTSMPSGMDKLTNLRYLNISYCPKLTSMPSGMGKLTNLRVLPMFVVGMEKRVSAEEQCMGELKDLKPLTNLKGRIEIQIGKFYKNDGGEEYLKGLKYLTQVQIGFGDKPDDGYLKWEDDEDDEDDGCLEWEDDGCLEWEDVMEKLEPPSNLKIFSLRRYKGTTIPRWGRALDNWALSLPLLVEIKLYRCFNLEQLPSLSKLRNLKLLSLVSLHKLEYMENTSSNNANEGEDFTAFFPSLESLYIEDLGSLKGWWREEELVEEDDDDCILRSSYTFPRLSKLVVTGCPKLTSFPSCGSLEDLGLDEVEGDVILRELRIDDVGLLNLINSPVNKLIIFRDEKVESLGDVFRKYKYTSYLRSLRITQCSNLRRLGRGGLEHLTALESLEFEYNYQLSFSEDKDDDIGMPWKSLQHCLRSLSIEHCDAIKSLPESMRNLTSLQNLEIDGCPELVARCKESGGEDWPKIQHIPHRIIED